VSVYPDYSILACWFTVTLEGQGYRSKFEVRGGKTFVIAVSVSSSEGFLVRKLGSCVADRTDRRTGTIMVSE